MKHICTPHCKYFCNANNNKVFFLDEVGVKHCKSNFICLFDEHKIKKWCDCKHFKSVFDNESED